MASCRADERERPDRSAPCGLTWFPRLFCPVRSAVLSPCTVGGVGHLGTRPSAFTLGPLGAPLLLARRPKQNGHDEILFSPPSTRTNVRKRNSGAGNQTVWFRPFPASRLCAHPRHSHCLMLRPKPDVQSGRGLRLPNSLSSNHLRAADCDPKPPSTQTQGRHGE